MVQVIHFNRRVDPEQQFDLLHAAILGVYHQGHFLLRLDLAFHPDQIECLFARNAQALCAVRSDELAGEHAHADQIGSVDTLETARDDHFDAEQLGTLGRPVAARSGAVFLAAEHHRRNAFADVAHGGIVDAA